MTKGIKIQLILLGVITLTAVLYILGTLAYLAGQTTSVVLFWLAILGFLPAVVFAFACLAYQVYRAFISGRCDIDVREIQLALTVISGIIFFGSFMFYNPTYVMHLRGLQHRMIRLGIQEELPAIRSWLSEFEIPTNSYPLEIDLASCHPAIKKLNPSCVTIAGFADIDYSIVDYLWIVLGQGCLVIGPEDMGILGGSETSRYTLPLDSGAYVQHFVR